MVTPKKENTHLPLPTDTHAWPKIPGVNSDTTEQVTQVVPPSGTVLAQLTQEKPYVDPNQLLNALLQQYEFGTRNGQSIVLRGIAQYLALNSNAVALPCD